MARRTLFILAACLLLALTGCQKKPAGYGTSHQVYQAFAAKYFQPAQEPAFLFGASLSWKAGNRSARVLLDFWGDYAGSQRAGTHRMDAWSNVGGSLCHILEGEAGLLAMYPDPLKVYTHSDPVRGARLLGLPFPFSLADLAKVLAGDLSSLVPERYDRAIREAGGNWKYEFDDADVVRMVLDSMGRPVTIIGEARPLAGLENRVPSGPWRMDFSKYEEPTGTFPTLPYQITVALPGEQLGILRIKTRELKVVPWPEKALELAVPDHAEVLVLDAPRVWTTGGDLLENPDEKTAE